jgi:hypothetical protein
VIAHRIGLTEAFLIIGGLYFFAFAVALVPAEQPAREPANATVA